ncbi:hypothetical protein TNCV_4099331 [Trichonephila clavipes]|nr:hypothetical protein TNCV_4099331 [Trichonephila clavipes]
MGFGVRNLAKAEQMCKVKKEQGDQAPVTQQSFDLAPNDFHLFKPLKQKLNPGLEKSPRSRNPRAANPSIYLLKCRDFSGTRARIHDSTQTSLELVTMAIRLLCPPFGGNYGNRSFDKSKTFQFIVIKQEFLRDQNKPVLSTSNNANNPHIVSG